MRLVTPETMAMIDLAAQRDGGIPGMLLMEQASLAVADAVALHCSNNTGKRILSLAGTGNNGGDALAAARNLSVRGFSRVTIVLVRVSGNEQFRQQLGICRHLGLPILEWDDPGVLRELKDCAVIIDGISGTGLKGNLRGAAAELIDSVNTICAERKKRPYTVAVDIPSGMHPDGDRRTQHLPADVTITMGLPKITLYKPLFRSHCGEIRIANPGFPTRYLQMGDERHQLVTAEDAVLPPMNADSFKNRRGHALVFAGSPDYPGAAILASGTIMHARTGLATLYTHPETVSSVVGAIPSVIVRKQPAGYLPAEHIAGYSAVLAGPGWKADETNAGQLQAVLAAGIPAIIDAGALQILAERRDDLVGQLHDKVVLTPHPGEFRNLCEGEADVSDAQLFNLLASKAAEFGCTIVYKTHVVITVSPQGNFSVVDGMNPFMGTAGSGDVLAAIITALAAQGMEPCEAAWRGSALHQQLGKQLRKSRGCFTAEELSAATADLFR